MKTLAISLSLALGVLTGLAATKPPKAQAVMCFFEYEQPAGMNKICYYDCLGSTVAITIRSIQLCPLSINR